MFKKLVEKKQQDYFARQLKQQFISTEPTPPSTGQLLVKGLELEKRVEAFIRARNSGLVVQRSVKNTPCCKLHPLKNDKFCDSYENEEEGEAESSDMDLVSDYSD